jgi:hypothetical protein
VSSSEPDADGGQIDTGKNVSGKFIVTDRDRLKLLDFFQKRSIRRRAE